MEAQNSMEDFMTWTRQEMIRNFHNNASTCFNFKWCCFKGIFQGLLWSPHEFPTSEKPQGSDDANDAGLVGWKGPWPSMATMAWPMHKGHHGNHNGLTTFFSSKRTWKTQIRFPNLIQLVKNVKNMLKPSIHINSGPDMFHGGTGYRCMGLP